MAYILLLFYAGIIVQAFSLLGDNLEKEDVPKILLCVGFALCAFLPGKHEHVYDVFVHLFIAALFFAGSYGLFFKRKILRKINKESLLIWNLILVYVLLRGSLFFNNFTALFVGVMSLPVVINLFFPLDKRYAWRVFLYVWFLFILVGIASSHFAFSSLAFFFNHGSNIPLGGVEMFLIGASFLYISINVLYIIELIPLAGKHQSQAKRIEEVKADMAVLASEYDTNTAGLKRSFLIILIAIVFLGSNYFINFIKDNLLVYFIVAILPLLDRLLFIKSTDDQKDPIGVDGKN